MLTLAQTSPLAVSIWDYLENKYPFVGLTERPGDHSTDNGMLFTATFFVLMQPSDSHLPTDRFVLSCNVMKGLIQELEVQPGLLNRYPGQKDSLNSHDNLIGVLAANFFYCDYENYYIRGASHFGSWNNVEPGKWTFRSWLARIPGVWAFVKCASKQPLNFFDQLVWSAACVWTALSPRGNTSGKCLQYLMNRVVFGRYSVCDWAIRKWQRMMLAKYPNGMREVYAVYFGENHPFAQYGPTDFT